jgi:hypothetical protein
MPKDRWISTKQQNKNRKIMLPDIKKPQNETASTIPFSILFSFVHDGFSL